MPVESRAGYSRPVPTSYIIRPPFELAGPQGKTNSCDNTVPCAFLLGWIAHVDAVDHVAGKIAAPVKDEAIADRRSSDEFASYTFVIEPIVPAVGPSRKL